MRQRAVRAGGDDRVERQSLSTTSAHPILERLRDLSLGSSRQPLLHDFAHRLVGQLGRCADQFKLTGVLDRAQALDRVTGSGYFAEIMGRAVGPTGSVLAWEPANFINERSKKGLAELHARVPNVAVLVTPANAPSWVLWTQAL